MAEAPVIYYRFRLRSYTAAQFAASNDILLERELGVELDTGRCKRGDGSTPWNDLGYEVVGLGSVDFSSLADGTTLQWDATASTWRAVVASSFVPTLVPDGTTFFVPANKQALFALPIELEGTAGLELDGALVEVN